MSARTLPDSGVKVPAIEFNTEDFLRSWVERYKELTEVTTIRRARTLFLTETSDPGFSDPLAASGVADSAEGALRDALKKSEVNSDTVHTALPKQLELQRSS